MVYTIMVTEKTATKKHPKEFVECHWEPICMKDLKVIKEVVASYGMHSSYVRKLVESGATRSRVTSKDWCQLISAVLEPASQI